MKTTKLLFLLLALLVFSGNAFATSMPNATSMKSMEHCDGIHADVVTLSEEKTTEPEQISNVMKHKECKGEPCSMKSCCVTSALQIVSLVHLTNHLSTFSHLSVLIEDSLLTGLKEAIDYPPISLS